MNLTPQNMLPPHNHAPQQGHQPQYAPPAQQGAPSPGFQLNMQGTTPPPASFQQGAPAPSMQGRMLSPEEAQAAMAKTNTKQTYDFHLKMGETKRITFMTGNLIKEGLFDVAFANEHTIRLGAKQFETLQCLNDLNQQCPMCEYAQSVKDGPVGYQAMRGFFTVIDHEGYTKDDGTRVPYNRKLYKASKKTMQQLAQIVMAHAQTDGHYSLVGRTFQVSRSSDKSAGVGDVIVQLELVGIDGMLGWLRANYPDRAETFQPIDTNTVLQVMDAQQIYGIFQRLGSGGGGGHVPYGASTGVQGYAPVPQNPGYQAPPPGYSAPPQGYQQAPVHQAPPPVYNAAPPQQYQQAAPPQYQQAPAPGYQTQPGYPQSAPPGHQAPPVYNAAPPQNHQPGGAPPPWNAAPPQNQGAPAYGSDVTPPGYNPAPQNYQQHL